MSDQDPQFWEKHKRSYHHFTVSRFHDFLIGYSMTRKKGDVRFLLYFPNKVDLENITKQIRRYFECPTICKYRTFAALDSTLYSEEMQDGTPTLVLGPAGDPSYLEWTDAWRQGLDLKVLCCRCSKAVLEYFDELTVIHLKTGSKLPKFPIT